MSLGMCDTAMRSAAGELALGLSSVLAVKCWAQVVATSPNSSFCPNSHVLVVILPWTPSQLEPTHSLNLSPSDGATI